MQKKYSNVSASCNRSIEENLKKIQEMKEKIKLQERCKETLMSETKATVKENEEVILKMRLENKSLRNNLIPVMCEDNAAINRLFASRHKSKSLLFRKKDVETVNRETDVVVCGLKTNLNKLQYIKKERCSTLDALQKKFLSRPERDFSSSIFSKKRQVENSLDKVKLKKVTAQNIRDVYLTIKRNLEDEIQNLPYELDKLEKEKINLKQEASTLSAFHRNVSKEAEETMKKKHNLESQVRSSRKQRNASLRQLRKKVKDMEKAIEEQYTKIHQHNYSLQKKIKRIDSDEILRLMEKQEKRDAIFDKISDYKNLSDLLESTTGIPFCNRENMMKCLRNHFDLACELENETKKKVSKLNRLRETHSQLQAQLDKILYEQEQWMQKKIEETDTNLKLKENELQKGVNKIHTKNQVAEDVLLCSSVLFSHLARSTVNMGISIPTSDVKAESDGTWEQFEDAMKAVVTVYEAATEKLRNTNIEADAILNITLTCEGQCNLFNMNNIRVPGRLERRMSEDFDNYNVPSNDQYVSRDMIKCQAEINPRPAGK
ncbi:uncharacterized protein LOC143445771 [Clavelina lepadiformis]|uniref:uncharacterized protein LOC143445771 n=1 Tax=Clavelina lepadiformis TaxID=159417 RepID=UPI0040435DF8